MKLNLFLFLSLLTVAQTHFQKRIFGGKIAEKYSIPNLVMIHSIVTNANGTVLFCGGTIYTPQWITTTSICASKIGKVCSIESIRVVAGKWNLSESESFEQVRSVVVVRVHEDFDAVRYGKSIDLGLLKLNESLILNQFVKAIPFSNNLTYPYGSAVIAGWGSSTIEETNNKLKSNVPKFLIVNMRGYDDCKNTVRTLMRQFGFPFLENSYNKFHLCTGTFTKVLHGPSYGDSGGPLMQLNTFGDLVVIGLISLGNRWIDLGLYIHVSHFIDWIDNKIDVYSYA